MMTVIVVSFGYVSDPYTASVEVDSDLLDHPIRLLAACSSDPDSVDELLPIVDNKIARHYSRVGGAF